MLQYLQRGTCHIVGWQSIAMKVLSPSRVRSEEAWEMGTVMLLGVIWPAWVLGWVSASVPSCRNLVSCVLKKLETVRRFCLNVTSLKVSLRSYRIPVHCLNITICANSTSLLYNHLHATMTLKVTDFEGRLSSCSFASSQLACLLSANCWLCLLPFASFSTILSLPNLLRPTAYLHSVRS